LGLSSSAPELEVAYNCYCTEKDCSCLTLLGTLCSLLQITTTFIVLADGVGLIAAAAKFPGWFPTDELIERPHEELPQEII
jgi:hypothetical protein